MLSTATEEICPSVNTVCDLFQVGIHIAFCFGDFVNQSWRSILTKNSKTHPPMSVACILCRPVQVGEHGKRGTLFQAETDSFPLVALPSGLESFTDAVHLAEYKGRQRTGALHQHFYGLSLEEIGAPPFHSG